jgi:hypothetical protein
VVRVAQGIVEYIAVDLLHFHQLSGGGAEISGALYLIGDCQLAILMYANNTVMFANSQSELKKRTRAFAERNRFEFNWDKSRVMHYDANALKRARSLVEPKELSSEVVKVVYIYVARFIPLFKQ